MITGLEQGRRQQHDSFRLAVEAVSGSQQEPQLTATLASLLDKVSIKRAACGEASLALLHCRRALCVRLHSLLVRCQVVALHLLRLWAAPGCTFSCHRQPQPAGNALQCRGQCQATQRAARQTTDTHSPCSRSQLPRRTP